MATGAVQQRLLPCVPVTSLPGFSCPQKAELLGCGAEARHARWLSTATAEEEFHPTEMPPSVPSTWILQEGNTGPGPEWPRCARGWPDPKDRNGKSRARANAERKPPQQPLGTAGDQVTLSISSAGAPTASVRKAGGNRSNGLAAGCRAGPTSGTSHPREVPSASELLDSLFDGRRKITPHRIQVPS